MAANGTNMNFVDTAKWLVEVEGDSQRRSTKFLVKRTPVVPSEGNPPDLSESTAVTVALRKAALEYGGITQSQLDLGYNPRYHFYGGAPYANFRVRQVGVWIVEVTLVYQWGGVNNAATGTPNLTFKSESSLESFEIKNGIANRFLFAAGAGDLSLSDVAPYRTVLNPNIEGQSQGLQIQVATTRFSWSFKLDYEEAKSLYYMLPWGSTDSADATPWDLLSVEYEDIVDALTGTVNGTPFAGRPAHSVRFDGGGGTINDKGEVDYTWNFTRKRLLIPTGLPPMKLVEAQGLPFYDFGDGAEPYWWAGYAESEYGGWELYDFETDGYITASPVYDGWDALSVIYDLEESEDETTVSPRVKCASIIQILPRTEFAYLRIPGVTPAIPAPTPEP